MCMERMKLRAISEALYKNFVNFDLKWGSNVESYTLLNFLFLNIITFGEVYGARRVISLVADPLIDGETLARGVVRFADD